MNSKGFAPILLLFVGVIVAGIAYFTIRPIYNQSNSLDEDSNQSESEIINVNSFEECLKLESSIHPGNPPTWCIANDYQQFKKHSRIVGDPTTGMVKYMNELYDFTFEYPMRTLDTGKVTIGRLFGENENDELTMWPIDMHLEDTSIAQSNYHHFTETNNYSGYNFNIYEYIGLVASDPPNPPNHLEKVWEYQLNDSKYLRFSYQDDYDAELQIGKNINNQQELISQILSTLRFDSEL